MDGGCVRSYYRECGLSNLLIEMGKTRFAEIDTRVSASRKSRIPRRTALLSLISFGFSAQARCARRAIPIMDRIRSPTLALRSPFRQSKFPASRNWQEQRAGQHTHRIRCLSVQKIAARAVTRDSRARIAVRNDVKTERRLLRTCNELRTELKSPCPNVAVSNPRVHQ